MATIANGTTSFHNTSRRSYLSVAPFNNAIFSYSTQTVNFIVTGALAAVVGATALTCPKGRVLYETGRKLYPNNVNPGVPTYMVAVYDPQSLLNGFIDPNSPLFASYNTDRPNFLGTWGVDPGTGGGVTNDLGAPVYTNGTVEASKFNINAVSPSLGATIGTATLSSGINTVSTTAVTATSKIFLTATSTSANTGWLRVDNISDGVSFRIASTNNSDANTVNWFIIN